MKLTTRVLLLLAGDDRLISMAYTLSSLVLLSFSPFLYTTSEKSLTLSKVQLREKEEPSLMLNKFGVVRLACKTDVAG